jgi:hypothetical protein
MMIASTWANQGWVFFSFETAWRTLHDAHAEEGAEKGDIRGQMLFITTLFGVAA